MAKGGGNQGGKGKGGKGGGKPTQRSQDYLRRYGYPSSKELRREAEGIAGGSVASVKSVRRPYERQAQSARDFLTAVQAALSETQGQVGAGYDQATSQQAALDAATQQRLAGLGLGVDSAGVQAAQGARGDSASANLLSNAASAKAYAAAQPGIASGNTGVVLAGLRKQETDALQTRRDQLRQSFFAALQNVQQNALARASFNQSGDQFQQNMNLQQQQFAAQQAAQAASQSQAAASLAEQKREFNITRSDKKAAGHSLSGVTGLTPGQISSQISTATDLINGPKKATDRVPVYGKADSNGTRHIVSYKNTPRQGQSNLAGKNFAQRGVPYADAIGRLVSHGIDPHIARYVLGSLYSGLRDAPPGTYEYDAFQSYLDVTDPKHMIYPTEPKSER